MNRGSRYKKNKNKKATKIFFAFLIYTLFILCIYMVYANNNKKHKIAESMLNDEKDALILNAYISKEEECILPLISYNKVEIDWGDGLKDEYISYKSQEKDKPFNQQIIYPKHKYKKSGIYKIKIKGDTKGGLFGNVKIKDKYDEDLFLKEFFDNIKKADKENKSNILSDAFENSKNIIAISKFRNLNFKGLGNISKYFDFSFNISKKEDLKNLNENFESIEIFWDTFAYSDIKNIDKEMFAACKSLRILNSTFIYCNNLKKIENNIFTKKQQKDIECTRYAFAYCKNLKEIPEMYKEMFKDYIIKDKNDNILDKETKNAPYLFTFLGSSHIIKYDEVPLWWGGRK